MVSLEIRPNLVTLVMFSVEKSDEQSKKLRVRTGPKLKKMPKIKENIPN